MLQAAVQTLIDSRNNLHETCKNLSQEQWFAVPDGFANNVAWNVGHLIVAQLLCHALIKYCISSPTGRPVAPFEPPDFQPVPAISRCAQSNSSAKLLRKTPAVMAPA